MAHILYALRTLSGKNQMQDTGDNLAISTIEELDPDPPSTLRLAQKRELLLGLLVLLGVLFWGGLQWWQQENKQSNYQNGQQAEARQDWDEARARYAAASDYKDATTRSAEAARHIAARDAQYAIARASASRQDWMSCLQAVQAVNAIQPQYGDVQQLAAQAEGHVYSDALSGTVALRIEANPPGLYYRTGSSWTWLRDSDRSSRIMGTGARNRLVYDTPVASSGAVEPLEAPRLGAGPGSRRLMSASVSGEGLSFTPLSFVPTASALYRWGDQGIWELKERGPGSGTRGGTRSSFSGYDIAYQAFDQPSRVKVNLPGKDWAVLNFAPGGDHILLDDFSIYSVSGMANRLYLASPDGGDLRLIYTYNGSFQQVQFSPDGRYVLLSTYSPLGAGLLNEEQSIVLIDTRDELPARTLIKGVTHAMSAGYAPAVGAAFLSRGPFAGKIMFAQWDTDFKSFTMLDPHDPDFIPMKVRISEKLSGPMLVVQQENDSGLLILGRNIFGGIEPYTSFSNSMDIVSVSPSKAVSIAHIPLRGEEYLVNAWIRDGHLLYNTEKYELNGRGTNAFTMYSLLISQLYAFDAGTGTLHSSSVQEYNDAAVGDRLLAYVTSNDLHVRTFDGSMDLRLEPGIEHLYKLEDPQAILGTR